MRAAVRLFAVAALAACGGSDDDAPAGGDAASAADAGGDAPTGPSDIRISQRSIDGASIDTGVNAVWWASAPPDPYDVVSQSGPCVLTEADQSGCDGLCDGVCIDGTCEPVPAARSAGRLTVSGGGEAIEIDPVDGVYSFYQGSPRFAAGDDISLTAAGDEVAAFEVAVSAVPDLVAPGIDDLELVPAEDFTVSWQPAEPDSWVRLRLDSNQHGQFSPTVIECAVADGAGTITVPGSMIERFWDSPGTCGECPVQLLVRYRRGSATAGGEPVVLEFASAVSFYPYR